LTAWLVAHTKGPANTMPTKASSHLPSMATPEATTPQAKAHMGGNQVMGLNSSVTADSVGRVIESVLSLTRHCVKKYLHF
jgi:hypothetical protein